MCVCVCVYACKISEYIEKIFSSKRDQCIEPTYTSHWHVSSRPEREACRYRIQRFLGSRGAIPQTICKITESFRFERDRKTNKSEEQPKISPTNCIETLAVMTFLRSPHCAT